MHFISLIGTKSGVVNASRIKDFSMPRKKTQLYALPRTFANVLTVNLVNRTDKMSF